MCKVYDAKLPNLWSVNFRKNSRYTVNEQRERKDDNMSVSKDELLHIAKLANLKLNDNEINNYLKNLEDILNYAEVIKNAPIEDCEETIGANDNSNAFRSDTISEFDNRDGIFEIAPSTERNMFKIPKVIQ